MEGSFVFYIMRKEGKKGKFSFSIIREVRKGCRPSFRYRNM